jgi:poly(A) polymerase
MAPLINNVPAARVFDEMLKLLMSGHALACLQQLRKEGLHHGLLPLLDVVLEQPLGEKFVSLALANTDARIHAGKVSPGFLFASLLWHQVLEKWRAYRPPANIRFPRCTWRPTTCSTRRPKAGPAAQDRLRHARHLGHAAALRAPRRQGPYKLLEHLRFRAGYDFLLLRCPPARSMPKSANGGPPSSPAMAPSVRN